MRNVEISKRSNEPNTGTDQPASGASTSVRRTSLQFTDPAEFDEPLSIAVHMPGNNGSQTYQLRDRSLARSGKSQLLSDMSNQWAGDIQLSRVEERFGMEIDVRDARPDLFCFGRLRSGRMQLRETECGHTVDLLPGHGAVHRAVPGTQASTADGTNRTNFWVAASRFDAALTSYLKEPPRERLVFSPHLDWSSATGASLGRLAEHVEAEFARGAGCMLDNPVALSAFIDLFVHTSLSGLAHNLTDRLARLRDGPAPRHVHRAEEFFRAHAHEPILMQDAAAAAGCSVRALQLAFRRFRDISPHAALTSARFKQARAALLTDDAPVNEIARRFGFSNAGRFAASYTRRFGEAPSQTRKSPGRG